jgi:NAD(P)-dependent dehydrogenase (short-subunit alcohol dehydrogenase family)
MTDVALICGAGGALGIALVDGFLARGDAVVGVDRSGGDDERLRWEAVDLTSPEDVEALWDRLGADGQTPRWVVNAVGGFRGGTVAATEPDEYRFVNDLNLGTAFWSCRAAARRLAEGAAIVNVSSRAAVTGSAGAAAYAVTKAAVIRLTEVLAAELAGQRVRVNAILPSVIDTPQNRATLSEERIRVAVPPEQIASVVAFLCSDAAAAISGAAVPVYGWA